MEWCALVALGFCGAGSVAWFSLAFGAGGAGPLVDPAKAPYVESEWKNALEDASRWAPRSPARSARGRTLFSSEPRVVAIGSGCPIPYDAETCPFTGAPQPDLNQLDRDGDGLTDAWELAHGLDRRSERDATEDPDKDLFTNLEEFEAGTNPRDQASRPSYAEKLRFGRRKDLPFPLVFKGFSVMSDGHTVFQIHVPAKNKTVFAALNEEVEGIALKRFVEGDVGEVPRLFVARGEEEIELERDAVAVDPQSKAELINILDRSTIIVTMGPLLSLYSDEYTVLCVEANKVSLRDIRTGEVFDIVGLAEEKR